MVDVTVHVENVTELVLAVNAPVGATAQLPCTVMLEVRAKKVPRFNVKFCRTVKILLEVSIVPVNPPVVDVLIVMEETVTGTFIKHGVSFRALKIA